MDGTDPTSTPPYVPSRQPPNVLDPESVLEGPTLYSGQWTYMYSAALHGTGGDAFLWVAGRLIGGENCDIAGPSNFSSCVPGIFYAQVGLGCASRRAGRQPPKGLWPVCKRWGVCRRRQTGTNTGGHQPCRHVDSRLPPTRICLLRPPAAGHRGEHLLQRPHD